MQLPKMSIVTPSFNSSHTIRETIESVIAQKYPNCEHLVMDGGSTDGTVDILKSYPHLIWISEKDRGHYFAMNRGIEQSTGEVVNILNADDCLRPGALQLVGEAFARNREWDALFGDIVYVDGKGQEIYRREEARYDYDVLRYAVPYVIHQTLFVRKATHDRLGLYRAEDFLNCCDFEFVLRMGKAGCTVGHIPQLLIDYRYHDFGQSADQRVTRNMMREEALIGREYGRPEGWLATVYRFVYRAKRQLQKLFYRGKLDLAPGTWRVRRHMRQKTQFTSNIDMSKLDGPDGK
jgi:glycosyltransferase involved in cell wall biosynthesis